MKRDYYVSPPYARNRRMSAREIVATVIEVIVDMALFALVCGGVLFLYTVMA